MTYENPWPDQRPPAGQRRRYAASGNGKGGRNGRGRKAAKPRWRKFFGIKAFLLYFLAIGFLGVVGVAWAYVNTSIPDVNEEMTNESTIVYWNDGETELGRFEAERRVSVGFDDMPQHLRDAVVAAEDRTFYENSGFDPVGIARAGVNFVRNGGEISGGGSTISQQYVKNYYLTREQDLKRKLDELFISIKINQEMDKNDIITDYLNIAWFGGQVHGVEVASQVFFGKSVSDVNLPEAASLAALIKSPDLYDPRFEENVERFNERFDYVIDGMVETGAIDQATADSVEPPEFKPYKKSNQYRGTNGYLLQAVMHELTTCSTRQDEEDCEPPITEEELNTGGYRIVTTFDRKKQKAAVNAVKEEQPEELLKYTHIGLAAVVPGDGAVVAMYGGPNAVKQSYDNAWQARPNVGSTIKPITLAAAFENDISLESRFSGNSPYEFEGLETPIGNQDDRDWGEFVTLEKATEWSINTAFVDLVLELGKGDPYAGGEVVQDMAFRAGIPEDTTDIADQGFRATLGIAPISPVDLADAYATLAAEGRQADWYTVESVTDRGGNVVYEGKGELKTVIDPAVAAEVTYALTQVVEDGSGSEAQALERPSAGKTGTHQDMTLWYSGYTPQLAASVSIFRENYKAGEKLPLEGAYGGSSQYPARIWTAFMKAALEGEEILDFPERGNIGEPLNTPSRPPTQPPTRTPTKEPTEDPEESQVPVLRGLSESQARQALDAAGLRVGRVTTQESTDVSEGHVLSSSPSEGSTVSPGTRVDLVLATAPEQEDEEADVPDVVGRSEAEATAILAEAGFQTESDSVDECGDSTGTVVDQNPKGGSSAPLGSTVTIFVGREPDGGCDVGDPNGGGNDNGGGPGGDEGGGILG